MVKGNGRAAFLLAETYNAQSLQALQIYGVRADPHKARELYQAAAVSGIEQAIGLMRHDTGRDQQVIDVGARHS
jgi:TPR repeat protein